MDRVLINFLAIVQHEQIVDGEEPDTECLISSLKLAMQFPNGDVVEGRVKLHQPKGSAYEDPIEVHGVRDLVGDRPFDYNRFSDLVEDYFRHCISSSFGWSRGSGSLVMKNNVIIQGGSCSIEV